MRVQRSKRLKHRIIPREIIPCDCGEEGEMRLFFPVYGVEIKCYYQGETTHLLAELPLNQESIADIALWYGCATSTSKQVKSLIPTLRGVYARKDKDVDGSTMYLIDSLIPVHMDNELGDYIEPGEIGSWVESEGTYVVSPLSYLES